MKALLKLLAVLILTAALLSTLAAAWVAWGFDPDDYRDEIARLISKETGLEVEIAGPIECRLLQGLEISVEGVSAHSGGRKVLDVERLEGKISLFGLLNHELVVKQLVLKISQLQLERDEQGAFNLLPKPRGEQAPQAPGLLGLQQVQIAELEVEIGQGLYLDRIRQLELKLEGLALRLAPVPVLQKGELVLDDPSLVMAFTQAGALRARALELDGRRLEGVETAFVNDHGRIDFTHLALRLLQGQPGKPGYLNLAAAGTGALQLGFAAPLEQLHETPWSAIDLAELQGLALDLAELELVTDGGRLRAGEGHLEAAVVPLLREGRSLGEMVEKPAEQPLAGITARGARLVIGATRLEEFSLTLDQTEDGFELVLDQGRLRVDPKRPQGPIQSLAARLDGKARLLIRTRPAGQGGLIESVRLESGALRVDELEAAADGKRLQLRQTRVQGRSLRLPLRDHPLVALLERLRSGRASRLRATGGSLQLDPVRLEDFDLSLGGKKGQLELVLNKGRLRIAPAAGEAQLKELALQLAGKARLELKRKKGKGLDSLVANAMSMQVEQGVVRVDAGVYRFTGAQLEGTALPLLVQGKTPAWSEPARLLQISDGARLTLKAQGLEHDELDVQNLTLELASSKGVLHLESLAAELPPSALSGSGEIRFGTAPPPWRLRLAGKQVPLADLLMLVGSDAKARGDIDLDLDLHGAGLERAELEDGIEGQVTMVGRDIDVNGIDLDAVLGDLESTRKIGLLDVGVVALVGPAGVLLTKGRHYTSLLDSTGQKGSSHVVQMRSQLKLKAGTLYTEDVALATRKHRLAVKGSVGFGENGPLDLQIATVDPKGCAKYLEQIKGSVAKPQVEKSGVVIKGVITPITSLLGSLTDILPGGGCRDPFYTGQVAAPVVKSKPLKLLE